jgi:hypothetical protein
VFEETQSPNGVQAILAFGDDYELSIVKNDVSYGGKYGQYEIALFKQGDFHHLPGITQEGSGGVRGWLSEEQVTGIIKKLHSITMQTPKQI